MFGTKLTFSRKENLRSLLRLSFDQLKWTEANFWSFFLGKRRTIEFSLVFFLVGEKPKLAKIYDFYRARNSKKGRFLKLIDTPTSLENFLRKS